MRRRVPIIIVAHTRNDRRHPMSRYYVNNQPQTNGDHEVHVQGCYWLQLANSTRDLGDHQTCQSAVAVAKTIYPTANGCAYCASPCHTR